MVILQRRCSFGGLHVRPAGKGPLSPGGIFSNTRCSPRRYAGCAWVSDRAGRDPPSPASVAAVAADSRCADYGIPAGCRLTQRSRRVACTRAAGSVAGRVSR